MYCLTCVNNLNCVLNELKLWTDISSEHPEFVRTVAQLSNKALPQDITNELNELNRLFTNLNNRVENIKKRVGANIGIFPTVIVEVRNIINQFLALDRRALALYPRIRQIGKQDKVWQTLLEHIIEEQTFMAQTFNNIKMEV